METEQKSLSVMEDQVQKARCLCGTVEFRLSSDRKLPQETYLLLGAFEHPESFKPIHHAFLAHKLPWLTIHDDAMRHQEFSVPRFVQTTAG